VLSPNLFALNEFPAEGLEYVRITQQAVDFLCQLLNHRIRTLQTVDVPQDPLSYEDNGV